MLCVDHVHHPYNHVIILRAPVESSSPAGFCYQGQGCSWRRRFGRRVVSRVEGGPRRDTGPPSGSPSRGMPSIHSTFAEDVAAFAEH